MAANAVNPFEQIQIKVDNALPTNAWYLLQWQWRDSVLVAITNFGVFAVADRDQYGALIPRPKAEKIDD